MDVAAEIKTFLIADVRGYTVFTQERGDEAAAKLASTFARIAREGVEALGDSVIELRGDEALAVFGSPRQAIRASLELAATVRRADRRGPCGAPPCGDRPRRRGGRTRRRRVSRWRSQPGGSTVRAGGPGRGTGEPGGGPPGPQDRRRRLHRPRLAEPQGDRGASPGRPGGPRARRPRGAARGARSEVIAAAEAEHDPGPSPPAADRGRRGGLRGAGGGAHPDPAQPEGLGLAGSRPTRWD